MSKMFLGIDVGTTGTKSILFNENGIKIADSYQGYESANNEQDALDWWNAVKKTVRDVVDGVNTDEILALSLSTQGGTVVPTDVNFNPIRKAILWSDTRCEQQRNEYISEVGGNECMFNKTGWMLVYALPLLEIRWLKENEPDIFNKADYFLTVHDFISAKLTGLPAVDMSNAGINEFLNVKGGIYDSDNLKFAGISEKQLAKIFKTGEVIGNITKKAATELCISEKTVMVAGAHDQYCVAVGAGVTKSGEKLIGSGTSWAITALSDRPRFDLGFRTSRSAIDGTWGSITSISSGGVCLEWLRKNIISDNGLVDLKVIDKFAEKTAAAEKGLFFFPFGEKLSDNDNQSNSDLRGSFIGMTFNDDKFNLARAVMEGICFQTRWLFDDFGNRPDAIFLAGGAAKSKLWTQMLADILNIKILIPDVADAACTGAAVIASYGVNLIDSIEEGCRRFVSVKNTVFPNPNKISVYEKAFLKYKNIAGLLKKIYYGE